MSHIYNWEENNKRYFEFKEALEVKDNGKCYFPCNDCRGLKTRRILGTSVEKHCKEKGHAEGGLNIVPW